mmetsp:Transcript_48397/g.134146  ORF Transcript_48397/g.134146 Transcript_48397/m.134146 type:complete len:145 (+) Transcript_48397:323-757(+)
MCGSVSLAALSAAVSSPTMRAKGGERPSPEASISESATLLLHCSPLLPTARSRSPPPVASFDSQVTFLLGLATLGLLHDNLGLPCREGSIGCPTHFAKAYPCLIVFHYSHSHPARSGAGASQCAAHGHTHLHTHTTRAYMCKHF